MTQELTEEGKRIIAIVTAKDQRLDRLNEDELLTAIRLMEELKLRCAREGLFVDAENSKLMVHNLRQALTTVRAGKVRLQHEIERQKLDEDFQVEMDRLAAFWDEKVQTYIDDCAKLEQEQEEAGQRAMEDYQAELAEHLPKHPRRSAKVIELQSKLQRLVQQQEYREAQNVSKRLYTQLSVEQAKFEVERGHKMQKLLDQAGLQRDTERKSLKKRISTGLNELLMQRDAEYHRLVQKFNNIVRSKSSQQSIQSKQLERSMRLMTASNSINLKRQSAVL